MNKDAYIKRVKQLYTINEKLCQVGNLLDVDLLSGPIGQLYDFAYDLMIPEGSPDSVYEDFGELVFSQQTTDEDIVEFYDNLFN